MWFISGLVLIYHSFPGISKQTRYEKQECLPSLKTDIKDVFSRVSDMKTVEGVKISQFQGQTLFSFKKKGRFSSICIDSTQQPKTINHTLIAKRWINAPILKIDTLFEREQWIMYSSYKRKMPIYKYYFDDAEKHQAYIASKTGKVLQLTNKSERFWAYCGAIPHKLYFPFLRKHTRVWINTFTVFGIIILLASIAGMYVGISLVYKRFKKTRKFGSPYTKPLYYWHHLCGLVFGVFLITWAISGAISLQKLPQSMVKTYGDYKINSRTVRGEALSLDKYVLDYRKVFDSFKDVKEISWSHYQDVPIYSVVYGDKLAFVDASSSSFKELYLKKEDVLNSIYNIHGKHTECNISLLNAYDDYYLSLTNELSLPVYKIELNDKDESLYYINPRTGKYKYLNKNKKLKKLLFSGLHYFKFKFFSDKSLLWTICIWFLCIGGIVVSSTGIGLSVKRIIRSSIFKK